MKADYYALLGVSPGASVEAIHRAWRAMARDHHPDRSREADAAMALLNEAWAVLGTQSNRRAYDRERSVAEPVAVQDVILGAARRILAGGTATDRAPEPGSDLCIVRSSIRVCIRFERTADPEDVDAWLRFGAVENKRPDCRVLVACRVLAPDEVSLRVGRGRIPAVAVDLIASRALGAFPCAESEALFRPFLS